MVEGAAGGPAEVINARGAVLLLPEDLTASFGTFFLLPATLLLVFFILTLVPLHFQLGQLAVEDPLRHI